MKKQIKKLPVIVPGHKGTGRGEHYGNPHTKLVRRQTNDQLLRESLNARAFVRLRVQPTIQSINGNYYGWNGGAVTVEADSFEAANTFVERLRKSIVDIATDLKLTAKANAVIS